MGNLYNRLKEASDGINEYTAQAKLNIYGGPKDVDIETESTVNVPFSIDAEYRSWGISEISLLVTATIQIPVSFIRFDKEGNETGREEMALKIDLSTAENEWVPGGFFGISELDISLTPEGGVANTKVVCVYIKKD